MSEQPLPPANEPAIVTRVPNVDQSEFALLLDSVKYEHLLRLANLYASSTLIPPFLQRNIPNCFIAIEMAIRNRFHPLFFLQQLYMVPTKGGTEKMGMQAQLMVAFINGSGLFCEQLQHEYSGEGDTRQCQAWTTLKSGKKAVGPIVSVKMAKSEGWWAKPFSKWPTMTDYMLANRASAFFGRVVCPQAMMGMMTIDELHDIDTGDPKRLPDITFGKSPFVESLKELDTKPPKAVKIKTETVQDQPLPPPDKDPKPHGIATAIAKPEPGQIVGPPRRETPVETHDSKRIEQINRREEDEARRSLKTADPDGSYSGDGAYDTGDDDLTKAQELADDYAARLAAGIPDPSTDPAICDIRTSHERFIEQCLAIDAGCLDRIKLYIASRAALLKRNNNPKWELHFDPKNWNATQTHDRRRDVLAALRRGGLGDKGDIQPARK